MVGNRPRLDTLQEFSDVLKAGTIPSNEVMIAGEPNLEKHLNMFSFHYRKLLADLIWVERVSGVRRFVSNST